MLAVVSIILPVFGIIFFGYLSGRLGLFGKQSSEPLNRFVYYFAFPALLFVVIARTPPEKIFYWSFVFTWTAALGATFVVTAVVSGLFYRDGLAALAMRCLNTTGANSAFLGVPLSIAAFGQEAALPPMLGSAILVTVLNNVIILLIEADRHVTGGTLKAGRQIALSLATNPLAIAAILGTAVAMLTRLPQPLERLFDLLGAAAVPCALFSIGVFIAGKSLREALGELSLLSFIKLVVHPAVTWLLAYWVFKLEPSWLGPTVLAAAMPPATACFVIAQRYDVYVAETSALMVIATGLSIVTLSALLALLGAG